MSVQQWCKDADARRQSTWIKTSSCAAYCNSNSRWAGLGLNPVLHGDTPATSPLNHETFPNLFCLVTQLT